MRMPQGSFMKTSLALSAVSVSLSCFIVHAEDISASTDDGRAVILHSTGSWEFVHQPQETALNMSPKYAEDAVEVWDKQLLLQEKDTEQGRYSNAVALYLHYKNNSSKRVVGLVVFVRVKSPLGKVALENTFEDETALPPGERVKNDKYWKYEENIFANDHPYNRLWEIARNGTAQIETQIRKVVLEDGTVLFPRGSVAAQKKVKKSRK